MDGFSEIIVVVILIVSILQIILFFKIWQMTNDTAEIKKTLSMILYRKFTIEKRKGMLIDNVFKKIRDDAVISDEANNEGVKEWVGNGFNEYKEYIQDQYEMYDLSEEFSIEDLKRDVIELFL